MTDLDPVPPSSGQVGLPSNIAACVACAFSVIGGLVFLVFERRNAYVRFYSMQSILFGTLWFVANIVVRTLADMFHSIAFLGSLLLPPLNLISFGVNFVCLAVYIYQIVCAFRGREWEIPYLGQMVRRQNSGR